MRLIEQTSHRIHVVEVLMLVIPISKDSSFSQETKSQGHLLTTGCWQLETPAEIRIAMAMVGVDFQV